MSERGYRVVPLSANRQMAPAARFTSRFTQLLASGELLRPMPPSD